MRTLWYKGYSLYRELRIHWGVFYKREDFIRMVTVFDDETAKVALFVIDNWEHLRSADLWNNDVLPERENLWYGFSQDFFEKAEPLQAILDARANERFEQQR